MEGSSRDGVGVKWSGIRREKEREVVIRMKVTHRSYGEKKGLFISAGYKRNNKVKLNTKN